MACVLSIGDGIYSEGMASFLLSGCKADRMLRQPCMALDSHESRYECAKYGEILPVCSIQLGKWCNYMKQLQMDSTESLLDHWEFMNAHFEPLVNEMREVSTNEALMWDLVIDECAV